jgi:hypothetical protein
MNLSLLSVDMKSDKNSCKTTSIRDTVIDNVLFWAYNDSIADIKWYQGKTRFVLLLENLTKKTMKINWDEITYVNPLGRAERLWHAYGRYIESDKEQVPTIIPSEKSILEPIIPVDNIYFNNGWKEQYLLVYRTEDQKQLNNFFEKPVQIYLPIYVGEEKVEYIFNFTISEITPFHF